jgi:hypothetical protein
MHTMAKPIANPNVTFSPEQLQAVIAQAIREHEESKAQKAQADSSDEMDRLCVKAFKRSGFQDVQPRVNILTYGKWVEKGFRVKPGEQSIKVRNLRLFHASQVEPISKKEQAEYLAKRAAKTSDRLPKPSPIAAAAPKAAKGKITPVQPAA